MKKTFLACCIVLSFIACNPNNSDRDNQKDTTNYGNAGMTGTMNANGLLPTDSNRTLNPSGANAPVGDSSVMKDSTKAQKDSL